MTVTACGTYSAASGALPFAGTVAYIGTPVAVRMTSARSQGLVLKTRVPPPPSAATAAAVSSSNSVATRAYSASASRCTQAIEEPGRMSWNWCSSTVFHSLSSFSYGYA